MITTKEKKLTIPSSNIVFYSYEYLNEFKPLSILHLLHIMYYIKEPNLYFVWSIVKLNILFLYNNIIIIDND